MSNGIVSSVTRAGAYEPFDLQVARNQIQGHSTVNIYGYQSSVTTTKIPLWENATAYTFPSSAVAMTVASAAGATDAGVKIQVQGLDASYNALNETVTLNASGTATTTGLFLRINALITTSGNATGIVTAKNAGTTYAQINVGFGRSLMSIYTVPNGYDFYLERVSANTSFNGNNTNFVTYQNLSTLNGVNTVTQNAPFVTAYNVLRVMPRKFSSKTDLQFLFVTSASTAAINLGVEGYLIASDVLTTQSGQ